MFNGQRCAKSNLCPHNGIFPRRMRPINKAQGSYKYLSVNYKVLRPHSFINNELTCHTLNSR